jgi:anaerobic magnesium-protoporphyrin IX monomethyl ester cyclase
LLDYSTKREHKNKERQLKMSEGKRVLFLILALQSAFFFTELPVGMGFLAEAAEAKGFEVEFMDMNLGYSVEELKKKIKRFKPRFIAVQMFSVRYKQAYETFDTLKKCFPDVIIIVGGAHPSVFREKVLEDCHSIDFAVYGEGEVPFIKLCSDAPLKQIPGLIYRKNGNTVVNPAGEFIGDLDSLSFPKYKKYEIEKFFSYTVSKIPKISICGSRGCPYQCTYCASGSIMGKKYRYRSVSNILDEIEYWYDLGVRNFSFVDDGFTYKKERVFEFCDGMEERKLESCALSLDNGVRADRVTREMLERMKHVGFWRVGIGVESGCDRVLSLLKKGESLEQIKETLRDLIELQYSVMLYFLVGSPGETLEDLRSSFDFALEFPVDSVSFNNIIPYPHTGLYDYLSEHRLLLMEPEDYLNEDPRHRNASIFETKEMPLAVRKSAMERAFAIEREVAHRSMRRRLNKFGLIGNFFAFFYRYPKIRASVMSNDLFRKIILNP